VITGQPKHYRLRALENLELLHVAQTKEGYANHLHETYGVCWVTQGHVKTHYQGSSYLSFPQSLTIMNPGEVHRGELLSSEGSSYYSFYPLAQTLRDSSSDKHLPAFKQPVVADKVLTQKIKNFVLSLREASLELQTHYLSLIAHLLKHYAEKPLSLEPIRAEQTAVARVKDYLHANLHEDVTLDELSKVANLNRSYLIRSFKKTFLLPPHAYLTQLRLGEAKKRLVAGEDISHIALSLGFADQSHFSRTFKNTFGLTPAKYARATFV
jgi:AraC-like DNA-binding protein